MLPREFPNLYFDGRWQEPDSTERFDVISPATGEKIGYVPAASETDIDRAVEAARQAFYETDWPTRPVEERAEIMERLAALIAEHQAGVQRADRRRAGPHEADRRGLSLGGADAALELLREGRP